MKKLLMITGDTALAKGKKGPFYYMLEEFSKYWERIDIICPRTEQKASVVHGSVHIHSSNKSKIFQPWFIVKKGIEIYRKQNFDLFTIHSYPPFYNDLGGLMLYNKLRTSNFEHQAFPFVLEVMHITGYPKAGNSKEWLYKILTRLFIKWSANKAIAIRIINKKQTGEFLKKAGVNEKKLKYIPASYIDLEIFKPQNLEKKYDIVFSGRLVKNKGIFLLLKEVSSIKYQVSNIKLAIVGSGPLENKIKKYIKKNKLEENVKFIGWVPAVEDLAKIYNQSKILVMPSFNEGGPRVTLEAMACKVPVITSRVGIMLDIVRDGENGLFIDWDVKDIAEKILLLLSNDSLRKKIAENGYKTAQRFERKKAIKNYAEAYQELIRSL